jgi:hypothetical protein
MLKNNDWLVVAASLIFVFTAQETASDEGENVSSCQAQFLREPLISRDLFVNRIVEDDFVQTVSANADYWLNPHIRSFSDGRMDIAARFEMMIEDAGPLTEEYAINSRSPRDFDHFDILVQSSTERPIWVLLGGTSEASRENWEEITLGNGDIVEGPGDMEYSGEFLHEFERVTWTSGQRYHHRNDEFYILRDSDGEIVEILQCTIDGAVPNPGCTVDFKVQPLWVTVDLRKYLLDQLPLIRQHSHTFVRCILQ